MGIITCSGNKLKTSRIMILSGDVRHRHIIFRIWDVVGFFFHPVFYHQIIKCYAFKCITRLGELNDVRRPAEATGNIFFFQLESVRLCFPIPIYIHKPPPLEFGGNLSCLYAQYITIIL